ncbi:hypothetical protein B9Q11_03170 [Candidatus Marsarchaeota G2 archaeon ECH_B_SAG-F08]|jgi:glyoxylase-like metal-dependent hydrolase (beta-lactamase superfamily II)|uniref:Metallo-beta-lactamase domain-containing protein n=4 Tax=Candidatus Marsarchaeota TaxID=1978152 RepID=A0A2R6AG74_9ARCH|nr:MAG: hypothetical protein B9Q02_06665 [Candidatus Marsarchaeota G1 archaeon BE_D]PSN89439.1 MAG: hypothetical protein B9Q00_01265 [Candidatus Marsarchaeota G1 archaeon OSP_C]PSN95106.1 MAG: hypothetical protein B9P99_01270 [Candidatus Marsarchaeota G1 archaeon OSP_B]PSN97982.1 MAG: hypothetical protein B9Q11_03170 [Candidatus Marsarchaeota G2 archaeon ECH_B_SAG-F08]
MVLPSKIGYLGLIGSPSVFAGYIVRGKDEFALIESGPSKTVDEYLEKVSRVEDLKKLKWVLVSHVHLDHAGGAWKIVEKLPQVSVGVYEKGEKHLIDPSKLSSSAKDALGALFDVWGEIRPTPKERLKPFKDEEVLELGDITLKLIAAPGHAPHSSVWYIEELRTLFCGDALGIYLNLNEKAFVWPTTPPPSFDYNLAMQTIERLAKLKIDFLCYPHYGYTEKVDETFEMVKQAYTFWFDVTKEALEKNIAFEQLITEVVKHFGYEGLIKNTYLYALVSMDLRGMMLYHTKSKSATH